MNNADINRLAFIWNNRGLTATIVFAEQARQQYRRAVLAFKKKTKSQVYRRMYINSYLFHKHFLVGNNNG